MNFEQFQSLRECCRDEAAFAQLQQVLATIAAERAQTETTLRQQAERERLVGAIAQHIRQSLRLDEILNTAVVEVRQLLQADRVLIVRCTLGGESAVVAESLNPGWSSGLGLTVEESWFQERLEQFQHGISEVVDDLQSIPLSPSTDTWSDRLHIRARLRVPILVGEQVWGVLAAHQCAGPRHWQAFEIKLLEQLSTQVAIAIQQSQLYQQTEHQAQKDQALSRVLQTIHNSLDLDTIFATAAREIGQFLQVDRADIVRYLPDRKIWLNVADYRASSELPSSSGMVISDEGNPLAAQLKQLQVVRIDDATTCEDEINRNLAQTFDGAWLLVPLHFGAYGDGTTRTVWGSLSLVRTRLPSCWQEPEIELARTVAEQLAIAIQQSELYQRVQQLNTTLEAQVQERTNQLERSLRFEALLKRITDKVRDSLDETQILQTVVQELTLGLNLHGCDTAIYDLDQKISTICSESIQSELTPALGSVLQMEQQLELYSQLVQGLHLQFCWFSPYPNQARPVEQRVTILAYPIIDDQGVLGDIWLFQQHDAYFDDQELRLVQQVANQCAIAIRQARLYQAAQGQVAKLETLNQLKDDFLSTVSHELRAPMMNIKIALQLLEVALGNPKPRAVRLHKKQKTQFLATSSVAHVAADSRPVRLLSPKVDRYLQILKMECDREIILINKLLDLQRLEAEAQPLVLEPICLQEWLPELIEPFRDRVHKRQQHLKVSIPNNLPVLTSDLFSLERIVTELLNNACKYTPPLQQISFRVWAERQTMHLQVSNSGVEIPAHELSRIFDKFHRVSCLDTDKQGGTGLGLALVKQFVEHLGGSIAVHSAEGLTCFTVDLSLTPSP